jgi:hypothetical protein
MTAKTDRETDVRTWPASGGKNAYLSQLAGEDIGRADAVVAKCAECCGGYQDGKVDCGVSLCPLYPWMPYRKAE